MIILMFLEYNYVKGRLFSSKYLKCKENYSIVRQPFVIILNTIFYAYVLVWDTCMYMREISKITPLVL